MGAALRWRGTPHFHRPDISEAVYPYLLTALEHAIWRPAYDRFAFKAEHDPGKPTPACAGMRIVAVAPRMISSSERCGRSSAAWGRDASGVGRLPTRVIEPGGRAEMHGMADPRDRRPVDAGGRTDRRNVVPEEVTRREIGVKARWDSGAVVAEPSDPPLIPSDEGRCSG